MAMILERILETKRVEMEALKAAQPLEALERQLAQAPEARDFYGALRGARGKEVRLIAEFKRASPSQGLIRADIGPADAARRYAAGGAAALSVLTDGPYFSGSLNDLQDARHAANLPALRKDFVIDPYQLAEARCAGADAALLIVAALGDAALERLYRKARKLGLAVLVEVHDEEELARALTLKPRIIGINNRNLRTFEVDVQTTLRLRDCIPEDMLVVSESGIRTRQDVLTLQQAGVDAVLVGESLMRQEDPGKAAAALLGR